MTKFQIDTKDDGHMVINIGNIQYEFDEPSIPINMICEFIDDVFSQSGLDVDDYIEFYG